MTKDKIKNILDFIPLIILTVYAIIMLWKVATTNIVLQSQHYIGLLLLIVISGLFIVRHKLGVLLLGCTLLLGLFNVLSYSAAIYYYSFGGSINGHSLDLKIQAIFLLWLLIHFIVSGRHYVGIFTKKYWQKII